MRLGSRFATFDHDGCEYGYSSALPLTHLAGDRRLFAQLQQFADPVTLDGVLGDPARAEKPFWETLLRCGVLVDADCPDPIHVSDPGPPPAQLTLYPTNSCNLRCVYCYASSGPGAGPRMTLDQAHAAITDFYATLPSGTTSVALNFHGGGEPTGNIPVMVAASELFRRMARDAGLGCVVGTISNGTFSPAVLAAIVAQRWRVLISFDGPDQDRTRPSASGRGSRDRVVTNLHRLREADIEVALRATVTRRGLDHLAELVDDVAQLGIRSVQLEPVSGVGRGGDDLADGHPEPLAFAQAFLLALRRGLDVGVAVTTSAWTATRIGTGRFCGAQVGMRALTPDGYLSACTEVTSGADPDDPFIVGRLDPDSGRLEIWGEREARLAARTGPSLAKCAQCHLVHNCAGGCANKARFQSGRIQVRDHGHCIISQAVNNQLIADIAEGRMVPGDGWQPIIAELPDADGAVVGRMVALVPPGHRRLWNADPARRPIVPATGRRPFFRLP